MIEQARLLTLKAAWMMDQHGNKAARAEDRDDQGRRPHHGLPSHRLGDSGLWRRRVTGDYGLAHAYATARMLRLADDPDEVHRNQIARLELRKYQGEPHRRHGRGVAGRPLARFPRTAGVYRVVPVLRAQWRKPCRR
jgi:acyl-CoA dehydrogenase